MLDDRTGLPSSSKTIRIFTWLLGVGYVIMGVYSVFNENVFQDNAIKMMDNIKDFLVFLIPSTEISYQYNRTAKMKWGSASLSTPEDEMMQDIETSALLEVEQSTEQQSEQVLVQETRKRIDI